MKGPIRKFSVELLNPKRNNNSGHQTQTEQVRGRERTEKAERRPSLDRWKKALFSQASRLSPSRVAAAAGTRTPRASSLDVSHSTASGASNTTTATAVTARPSWFSKVKGNNKTENANANESGNEETPPPRTPSSLSLSGSFSIMSSDFLSRENELLGGSFEPPAGVGSATAGGVGEIDLDAAASAFPDISLDGSGDIPIPTQAPVQQPLATGLGGLSGFEMATPPSLSAAAPAREVKVTGDDEIERFEDQFPDIGPTISSPPKAAPAVLQQPMFGAAPPFAPRPQPSALNSTPILQEPLPDEDEPEPIKIWRERQAEEIKKRDEASAARREETIAKAERSIDHFYEEYNAKKERNIKENKIQEQEYLASATDALSAGTTWSRICEFIDLQNSQSKTLARTGPGTTDLTRFKEVLLRLKREGEGAPGAAGY